MEIKYITEEDLKKERELLVASLTEDKKTDFVFEDENFYVIGSGHNFVYSFYNQYITKSSIIAYQYVSGLWSIGGEEFHYIDGSFQKIEPSPIQNIDWNALSFPVVKNVSAKLLGDEIQPVIPKDKI